MKNIMVRLQLLCILLVLTISCEQETPDEIHIPFTIENNRMVFDVTVNGQKKRCLFDSGADASFIDVNATGLLPMDLQNVKAKDTPNRRTRTKPQLYYSTR